MAAVNPHIGTQDGDDRQAALQCDLAGELGAARACIPEESATHNGLTRMLWIRRTLEDLLENREVGVADGKTLGKKGSEAAALYFTLDPPFTKHEVVWMPAATERLDTVTFFGEAQKMACPTWDLPAGAPVVGGSCPGATAGQSVVPLSIRRKAEPAVGAPVKLRETICQLCYASGGQYASPHVQMGELVRYWWCRELMATPAGQNEWVATMVRALQGLKWKPERMLDPRTNEPILPIRVHSSGDFFSVAYARAWIRVMNEFPQVMFWAPTRTWASPGWVQHWRELLEDLRHGNLALRPSAYHTGDAAPAADDHPWPGDYPFTSAGTTAIYKFDDGGQGNDPRYDWACKTYAILDEAHTCQKALAPDGETGCRACWIRPDLRIDYAAH